MNSPLPTSQKPYFSAITPVLPASIRQINPISWQIVRTIRQVITTHPADNRDQLGDDFNNLLFYTKQVHFFNIFLRNASESMLY